MAKALILSLLVLCLSSPANASGMGVFDAVANMYNALELEQSMAQVQEAIKQYQLMEEYTSKMEDAYDKAHTNYKKMEGVYDDLMKTKKFLEDTKSTWVGRYGKYKGLYDKFSNTEGVIEDFRGLIDDAFIDPRNLDPEKWRKVMDKQFDLRQLALKDILEKNEETMKGMEDRMVLAEKLAKDADSTESEKEAMDVTNRLLLEILVVLQEMLAMDARYQQAMASLNYDGVSEETIQARLDTAEQVQSRLKEHQRYEELLVEKVGVNENDSILTTINKATGL